MVEVIRRCWSCSLLEGATLPGGADMGLCSEGSLSLLKNLFIYFNWRLITAL